jgi:two-component SAPR family response regulator
MLSKDEMDSIIAVAMKKYYLDNGTPGIDRSDVERGVHALGGGPADTAMTMARSMERIFADDEDMYFFED